MRLFLILGSLTGLGLAIAGTAAGTRRDAPAVTLAILGAAGLTLGLVDVRAAVLAATAGGLFGVLVTLVPRGARAGATVGILEARAVVVAGALAIAATAWFGRDLSQMAAQPVVFGLAYLAFAIAVAIRFGEIPFHLWAARLTDVVPETSLPVLTALAPASLAIVALAWIDGSVTPLAVDLDAERLIVLGVALASIVLAGVAATLQEDIEHVLGYSIVGDAGVILLAFVALDPAAGPPARLWVLAFVVARSAFAAWVAGIRAGFWTGRVADLRGWARRSPVLALAFLLVVLASVGFPGLAAFDARSSVVSLSLDPRLATPVLLATLLPLVYYGRLLAIGLSRPDREAEPVDAWRPRLTRPDVTAVRPWLRAIVGRQPRLHDGPHRGPARPAGGGHLGRRVRWPGDRGGTTGEAALAEPAPSRARRASERVGGAERERGALARRAPSRGPASRPGGPYSFGASTQRSMSRSYSCSSAGSNHRASSDAADSALSEACTMFCAVSSAKSPRIVPGAASCGRVAPLIARTTAIAFGPSSASATSGPEMMNSTSPAKNGFSRCAS